MFWFNTHVSCAVLLLAPWSWKASELSLQNRCRYRLPHQYARWSGQPPTGLQHTGRKNLFIEIKWKYFLEILHKHVVDVNIFLITFWPPSAVRQCALQQIPLRGSLQACTPEPSLSSGSAIYGLPPSSPEPIPPGAPLPQWASITSVLHLPPAGLLLLLFNPQALPSARPSLLHHSLDSHRTQVQRPSQDSTASHLLSDRETGWTGLHPTPSSSACATPPSPDSDRSAGLVPSTSSSGDALWGGLQGEQLRIWRKS